MKKIISLVFAILIFNTVKAQSVVIVNECKKSIDLYGDIIINPTAPARYVVLKSGVEIKCNTLTIDANTLNIQVNGTVKIKCNRINTTSAAVINVNVKGSGTLIFEYPAGSFSNLINLVIDTNTDVKLSFVQN